ncbi:MAG: hypothetical protein MJ229_01810 [bacterium]|nr:hypothetical protein [bacterium]
MGFFKTLNDIKNNSSKLESWEQQNADTDAKREELNRKREHKQEEIKAAQALGETIIDVVDIMDNHSESVSENVETAIMPAVEAAPMAVLFGSFALATKKVFDPAVRKIKSIENEFRERPEVRSLLDKLNEGKEHYSIKSLSNKVKIDKIKDSALKAEAKEIGQEILKATAKESKKIKGGFIGALALTFASFIGANVLGAKIQVRSSKVARYQAREELKDEKDFVQYTPEQIEKAKAELEANPELKKEKQKTKLKQGFLPSIINLFRDEKAYKEDRKNYNLEEKKVKRDLSSEELEKAEKDKEVIQRTIKKINNEAEKYSENMEVASGVLIGGTPWLGAGVGVAISWIMEKTGVIKNFVSKTVENLGSDDAKQAYEELNKMGKDVSKSKKIKSFFNFAKEMFSVEDKKFNIKRSPHSVREVIEENGLSNALKKGAAVASSTSKGAKALIGIIGGFATGIVGAFLGMKMQKEAARAGRYTAKRELEKDPMNFIGYTKDELAKTDVKDTSKKTSKVKEVINFVPTCIKQYFDYMKYRKTEFKENQILKNQLKKQDVTEEQLKEARNLQNKLFVTFENVDDKSQEYSESMEATCEMAQPIIIYAGYAAMIAPFVAIASAAAKGKLSPNKIIEKVSKIMADSSNIMKSKFVKKYLNDVSENVSNVVQNMDVDNKIIGKFTKGIDIKTDTPKNLMTKILNNVKDLGTDFRKMDESAQIKTFDDIKNILKKTKNIEALKKMNITPDDLGIDAKMFESLKNINIDIEKYIDDFSKFENSLFSKNIDAETRADVIDILLKNNVKDIPRNRIKEANKVIESISKDINYDLEGFSKIFDKASLLLKFAPDVKVSEILSNLEKLGIKNPTLDDITTKWKNILDNTSDKEFDEMVKKLGLSFLEKDTVKNVLPRLEKICQNVPKEELNQVFNSILKELQENPDEFIAMLKKNKVSNVFMTPNLKKALAVAGISWTTFTISITYAIESWLADMQLKSGRLGVMKALEELDDNAYYADIED